MNRRDFTKTGLAAVAASVLGQAGASVAEAEGLDFGPVQPFSFEALRALAKQRAGSAYSEPPSPAADIISNLSFDASQAITFRRQCALWATGPGRLPVRFFHLNKYVGVPVRIHVVTGRTSREVLYRTRYFDYGTGALAAKLPADLGFAGFRVMDGRGVDTDWLAFQGASYFRAAGEQGQYGISARGIAVDTAMATREEFPRFSEFWLKPGSEHASNITIYALLEGPSVTGAFAIEAVHAEGVITTDVQADLFARADIQRLGIAPLTSMYWYRENDLRRPLDWRPAIHDSDGLALWTGKGERLWRPLNDPPRLQTNSFFDTRPKGFGLSQRDRDFDDYQDDGAFYNRRPSVWVEPKDDWADGAVQLVEIPTDDEIHDNIVAFWQPKAPVKSGSSLQVRYRLYWQPEDPPPPAGVARVLATRVGLGGVPGQPRPSDQYKFAIDFDGPDLRQLKQRYDIEAVVSTSRGKVVNPYVIKVVGTTRWRAIFDVSAPGKDPINLRCFLRLGEHTLSETWLYQFFPPS
jgi:periplasmic glucans biosynthesis protein